MVEKLSEKHNQLIKALESLHAIITRFDALKRKSTTFSPEDFETEFTIYRDSLIQRFEYCTDLFWKYLKKYLESIHALPDLKIPREVISTTATLGLISNDEAETILEMIKSRNLTSHIYVEEIADQISKLIPEYYLLLQSVSDRLYPR